MKSTTYNLENKSRIANFLAYKAGVLKPFSEVAVLLLFKLEKAIDAVSGDSAETKNSKNTSLYQVNCIHSQSARSVRPPDNEPPAMDTIEDTGTLLILNDINPIALYPSL